ncbi:hypothetical protein OUZ56_001538 [Daphnia magna]|uniref:Uncharacterized protein n=1 Tax=Daphnia magna TaxID=35525 RepID=A0ABR0A3J2_9CRUS|nr:hypothetical protein OUZ56_001538 [Daphnia magna]
MADSFDSFERVRSPPPPGIGLAMLNSAIKILCATMTVGRYVCKTYEYTGLYYELRPRRRKTCGITLRRRNEFTHCPAQRVYMHTTASSSSFSNNSVITAMTE